MKEQKAYKEVDNNTKRCMKRAKEYWIGEWCCEVEENLRKNNNKRAYQLVKDLTTVKQAGREDVITAVTTICKKI